ncbi:MAG TPA: 5-formyltetrahydrofolate cyclo-ligase [Deltaproteobacteria bacterium]|nr:5-formyltetrahydrofolate cyclo-ligase [Deltaproteobacteria bacterium]
MINKDPLRRQMRALRGTLTPEVLGRAGEAITARILDLPEVQRARTVMCYVAFRREVPTAALIDGLRRHGIDVAVPRILPGHTLEARRLEDPLVPGALGIPTSDGPVVEVDVCVCPGLAFDPRGGRLGYGKGYYDRWLEAHAPWTVGICVEEALLDTVPTEATDQPMAAIVTPERVLRP